MKYYDTPTAIEASELIVTSSGFSPDRSEYSRSIQRAVSEPREPEYDPKFVGSLGRGDQVRVMIVWRPGEEARTYSIGDKTPWGYLTDVTSTELKFKNGDSQKNLLIF